MKGLMDEIMVYKAKWRYKNELNISPKKMILNVLMQKDMLNIHVHLLLVGHYNCLINFKQLSET